MQLHREFQAHSTSKALTELLPHRKGGRFRRANEGVRPTPADRAPLQVPHHIIFLADVFTCHGIGMESTQHPAAQHKSDGLEFQGLPKLCLPARVCRKETDKGKLESKTLTASVLQPLWIVELPRRVQSSAHTDPGAVLPLPRTSTNTGDLLPTKVARE